MSGADSDGAADRTSLAVVSALAAAEGTDPRSLSPPLSEVIDAEALDALVRDGPVRVTFSYDDRTVTVSGDGTVLVDGTAHEP